MKLLSNLSPKQNLLRLIYGSTLSMARPIGEFSTWVLTGVAVIIGSVLVNIEPVSKIVSTPHLKWGLSLLIVSLLAGAVCRQIGVGVSASASMLENLYAMFESPEGHALVASVREARDDFRNELTSAYLPPLSWRIERSFNKGAQDPISGEKNLVKLVCIQIYCSWIQGITAASGLVSLLIGIS